MKMFKYGHSDKLKLAVHWGEERSSFFLFGKSANHKYGSAAPGAAKEFLGDRRPSQTLLIIPRSEVLQKEMSLAKPDARENLEARLAQLLPYSPQHMAYSLALDSSHETAARGLLYAIPEEKISRILSRLRQSGISVDEVVSEDQTLFWLFQDKAASGPILIFDETPERMLVLALKQNAIILSRVYPCEEPLKNVLSEISFCLLESGTKPVKAFVLGPVDREEVARAFEIPVESIEKESLEGAPIPFVLSGAKKWGMHPAISLLPSRQKIERRVRQERRLLTETAAAFGVWLVCFSMLAASHLAFLKFKKMRLEKESAKISAAVSEARRMTDLLMSVRESERSKERLLLLLRELAERLPSSVRFRELQIEDKNIVFSGESPSHAFLTETVQAFEKIQGVKEAKLEHARLRKRLSQDFFDFEVTARWQS